MEKIVDMNRFELTSCGVMRWTFISLAILDSVIDTLSPLFDLSKATILQKLCSGDDPTRF
jgi:hypothetical protein